MQAVLDAAVTMQQQPWPGSFSARAKGTAGPAILSAPAIGAAEAQPGAIGRHAARQDVPAHLPRKGRTLPNGPWSSAAARSQETECHDQHRGDEHHCEERDRSRATVMMLWPLMPWSTNRLKPTGGYLGQLDHDDDVHAKPDRIETAACTMGSTTAVVNTIMETPSSAQPRIR